MGKDRRTALTRTLPVKGAKIYKTQDLCVSLITVWVTTVLAVVGAAQGAWIRDQSFRTSWAHTAPKKHTKALLWSQVCEITLTPIHVSIIIYLLTTRGSGLRQRLRHWSLRQETKAHLSTGLSSPWHGSNPSWDTLNTWDYPNLTLPGTLFLFLPKVASCHCPQLWAEHLLLLTLPPPANVWVLLAFKSQRLMDKHFITAGACVKAASSSQVTKIFETHAPVSHMVITEKRTLCTMFSQPPSGVHNIITPTLPWNCVFY